MQGPPGQPPYGAPPGQPPYGGPPGQPPYGSPPGQPPYGAPPGQSPYGAPPPYGAPSPYGAPYPPVSPNKKFPWVIVIVVAVIGLGLFGLFIALGISGVSEYMARSRAAASAHAASTATSTRAPAPISFSQTYSPRAGLVVAHYPAEFVAKNLDSDTIVLDHNLGFGIDEAVLIAAVPRPITDDVNEFARVLILADRKHMASSGDTYREISRAHSACFRGIHGLEVHSQAKVSVGVVMQMWTCFFMHKGHAYELKTIVPRNRVASDGPLLARIVAATDLTD
jgi:hypothetical protein